MSYIVQHIRSTEEGKRPRPAQLAEGQFALNVHDATPGVFLKTTEDKVVKVGGVAVGPNVPFAVYNNEYSVGELWYNTETKLLNIYDGAEWTPTYSEQSASFNGQDLLSRIIALEFSQSTDTERAAGDAATLSEAKDYVDNTISTLQAQINLRATIADTDITAAAVVEVDDKANHLITLSGAPEDADDLGTFTGTTIGDNLTVKAALQSLETALESNSNLSNIVDGAQGVEVTGRVAAEGLDLSVGGQITAAGCSVDFQSATISFSGASISGLSGEIRDNVDLHLNQSTATDGQVLSWDASANAGNGDYAWVAAPAAASTASTFTWNASIIPDTNAQYDIGSAEYKVRHLFLSDNSIYFGDAEIPLTVDSGDLTFGGIPIMPRTLQNVLTTLGVESYADQAAALVAGLIEGDVYYDTTINKLTSVTA